MWGSRFSVGLSLNDKSYLFYRNYIAFKSETTMDNEAEEFGI